MASQVWTNCKVWLGQYDVGGVMNAVALNEAVDLHENTVFGNTFKSRLAGLGTVDAQCEGFVNIATGAVDDYGFNNLSVASPLTISPGAGAEADIAYFFQAMQSAYKWGAPVGDIAKFSLNAQGYNKNGLIRGNILSTTTQTTTGTSTAQNLGAVASGQKLHAALHVLAASGTSPSLTMKIQSDTVGFPSATDQITFSAMTAAGSQYANAVAGPITDTYWRASWTITGTTPSFTWILVMGIK